MSGHTPGPWEFLGDPDDDECRVRQSASVKNGRGYSSEITICENIQKQANANLIAAAPDLLGALETITNLYADEMYSERSIKEEDLPEVMAARKAIARAKGKA